MWLHKLRMIAGGMIAGVILAAGAVATGAAWVLQESRPGRLAVNEPHPRRPRRTGRDRAWPPRIRARRAGGGRPQVRRRQGRRQAEPRRLGRDDHVLGDGRGRPGQGLADPRLPIRESPTARRELPDLLPQRGPDVASCTPRWPRIRCSSAAPRNGSRSPSIAPWNCRKRSGWRWTSGDQTKGVFVSFDTSTGGRHSLTGLPGTPTAKLSAGRRLDDRGRPGRSKGARHRTKSRERSMAARDFSGSLSNDGKPTHCRMVCPPLEGTSSKTAVCSPNRRTSRDSWSSGSCDCSATPARSPTSLNPEFLRKANIPPDKVEVFYRRPQNPQQVCPRCGGTGFVGQTGIFEPLVVTDAMGADDPSRPRAGAHQGRGPEERPDLHRPGRPQGHPGPDVDRGTPAGDQGRYAVASPGCRAEGSDRRDIRNDGPAADGCPCAFPLARINLEWGPSSGRLRSAQAGRLRKGPVHGTGDQSRAMTGAVGSTPPWPSSSGPSTPVVPSTPTPGWPVTPTSRPTWRPSWTPSTTSGRIVGPIRTAGFELPVRAFDLWRGPDHPRGEMDGAGLRPSSGPARRRDLAMRPGDLAARLLSLNGLRFCVADEGATIAERGDRRQGHAGAPPGRDLGSRDRGRSSAAGTRRADDRRRNGGRATHRAAVRRIAMAAS